MNNRLTRQAALLVAGFWFFSAVVGAESWEQAWSGDDRTGTKVSLSVDTDSFRLSPSGSVVYRIKFSPGKGFVVCTREATPQRRVRTLRRAFANGKVELPGDGSKDWEWREISKLDEPEYAFVSRYFNARDAGAPAGRWAKVATDIEANDYYIDTKSLTWLGESSCRVWLAKVCSGETPGSEAAVAYIYHFDRSFEPASVTGGTRTPIRPETVQEAIWNRLFKK